jgi:flavodoxin
MKSLIVYYSYTGNTEKAAHILKEVLSKKGEADIVGLHPEDESRSFFVQAMRAFRNKRAVLAQGPFDVAEYDLICVGNPVWAFAPTPAVNSYIDNIRNLKGKDVVCFVTYGSGTGADKCLKKMKAALKDKGAFKFSSFKIQQGKVKDEGFVRGEIEKSVRLA